MDRELPTHLQLLLLVARRYPLSLEEMHGVQSLVAGPFDWDAFLALTLHHRLAPLVFENLERQPIPGLPDKVHSALREHATANAFAAFRIMRELQEISAGFADAGLPMTALKGIPLSQVLFGSPNMRHVGDIDLLTSPENLPEQLHLLAAMGYQRVNPRSRLTPRRLKIYTSYRKDFTLRNPDTGFDLDLHWRLFDNRQHAGNRILEEARYEQVQVYGISTRVLSLEDQFLYTLSHGVSDAFLYLKSLADVSAFLRLMEPEQIDRALARAERIGLLPQIAAAIQCANLWMGANFSHLRLTPGMGDGMAAHIQRRVLKLLAEHDYMPNRTHVTPMNWLTLETKLSPGLQSSAELLGHVLWRPRPWSKLDLPDGLFWLYPVLGMLMPPRSHSPDY